LTDTPGFVAGRRALDRALRNGVRRAR